MAIRFEGRIYLFEFKVAKPVSEGRAIEQLRARGYTEKYHSHGEPIAFIGVEFSREEKNIVGFDEERVKA